MTAPAADLRRSLRQIDALSAGMALLDRIGHDLDAAGVRTCLNVSDIAGRSDLDVVLFPIDGTDDTPAVLDGISAAADALGLPLAVTFDFTDSLALEVRTDIAGIRVRVSACFRSPDGIAAARAIAATP